MDKPEWLPVRQIAARYGLHKSTIHRLLSAKRIIGKKVGRSTLVNVASMDAYMDSRPDR